MKKQWIAYTTNSLLICSMLVGCSSKPQPTTETIVGNDQGCTDEAILSQLKNDGTPEFVLEGTYYTLPLEASKLIDAGWSLETEQYDAQDVSLQPGERIYGELTKGDQKIDVAIVNDGAEPCNPAQDGTVIELEYSADKNLPNPDFFVTINGINCAMSNEALQKALEGVEGYALNSAGNIDINQTMDEDEIATYKVILSDDFTTVTLASDNIFEFKDYQPQEMKEQQSNEKIAAYKETTKAEMEPYAQDFNAIVEGFDEDLSVGFYSEGTVWGEEVAEYKLIAGTPLASDVSLYVVEDQSGQLYCVNNQILNEDGTVSTAIELQEGDQIKVWGYASQYLELQEGLKIIVVQPGMIECNGKLEILDQNLRVD